MRQVLWVSWYRFRATFGRRWGGYVAIVSLIGLLGGVAMGAAAGARRTQSSFPAFLSSTNPSDLTVEVLGLGDDRPQARAIARLPHVNRVAQLRFPNAFKLGKNDQGVDFPSSVGLAGSVDGLYFSQDRAVAVKGRMADPRRADEMIMTADAARALRAHVGDVVPFGFWTLAQQGIVPFFEPPPVNPYFRVDVKVVGIVVLNSTLVEDDIDRYPALALFTPALMRRAEQQCPTSCMLPGTRVGLQVDHRRSIAEVAHEVEKVLPGQNYPVFEFGSILETKAQRAIKPASIALGVFGAIAALATLLIAAQVLGRQLQLGADDLATLRALGAGPGMTSIEGLIGTVGAIVVGSLLAGTVAVGLSPLAPIGLVRRVYPSSGITFDWTVLGLGIVTIIVVLSLFAAVVAFRQAPHRVSGRSRHAAWRGSRLAQAAATSGLVTPAVAGVRFALEPGRGRDAVPVRSVLVATALAVIIVVATLVFGSSLDTLISRPALYGWNWSYALQSANNGPIPPQTQAALDRDPDVIAWNGVTTLPLVHIDGLLVPAFAQVPHAQLAPPILSGHAIDGRNQMILGTATLARLHKHVGDTVIASLGLPKDAPLWIAPARFRVVGTATFPTIGLSKGQNTSMSTGALIADTPEPRNAALVELRHTLHGSLNGPNMVLVQLRRGVRPAAGLEALQRIVNRANTNRTIAGNGWTISVLPVQRPAEIVNYRSMGNTPALLAAALAVGASVALASTLTASVRRRRRDLALFKTLGFTRRQLAGIVASQASVAAIFGTVIGVPIGIVTGRWLWTQFAHEISAVPQPTVPGLAILLVIIGALIFANLVAAIPGLQAARTPGALLLHAD